MDAYGSTPHSVRHLCSWDVPPKLTNRLPYPVFAPLVATLHDFSYATGDFGIGTDVYFVLPLNSFCTDTRAKLCRCKRPPSVEVRTV